MVDGGIQQGPPHSAGSALSVLDAHPMAVGGHDTRAPRRCLLARLCALIMCALFGIHPQQGAEL